jgi:amidase
VSHDPQRHGRIGILNRRNFLRSGVLATAAAGTTALPPALALSGEPRYHIRHAQPQVSAFELDEATIAELQAGMQSGKYMAHSITQKYLGRIKEVDRQGPAVNSVIEINPDALKMAQELDQERKSKGPRGPLHGIPVLIKDNIGTADRMQTTAGSLALVGSRPPQDSFVAQQLRAAGAVILGKTNLSEWANFRSDHSTSGWSGRGGLTRNPYALDRNPCGSSSGSGAAAAASLCAVAIGTETDGSIVCPSSVNGLVGIKPTVGLISRSFIIPISHSQDTAGPMARTVTDAAILLGALTGMDPADPATAASRGKARKDYTPFLDPNGLKGARIGVVRKFFGFNDRIDALMNNAIEVMKKQGATMVDPANIDSMKHLDGSESQVLYYEFKADLNAYLASLGAHSPMHTLEDLIKFNEEHAKEEMPYFGQEIFIKSQAKGPLSSKEYVDALAKNHRLTRTEGIDAVMDKLNLDAFIGPTSGPAFTTDLVNGDHDTGGSSGPAAIAGYPAITVPAGFVFGLPVGISFFGRAWSEPKLIKLAYAFEQATKYRQPPKFLPEADLEI